MNAADISELTIAKSYFSERIEVFNRLYKNIKSKENMDKFRKERLSSFIIGLGIFVVYSLKFYMVYWRWYMNDSKLINRIFYGVTNWFQYDSFIGKVVTGLLRFISFVITYLLIYFVIFILIGAIIYGIKVLITLFMYKKVTMNINVAYSELIRIYSEYEENTNTTCPVPFERIHPELIEELLQVIYSSRANTVQGAISVIIQDEDIGKNRYMGSTKAIEVKMYNKQLKLILKNSNIKCN